MNKDYIFKDENGQEYISSPEVSIANSLMLIFSISMLVPALMVFTLQIGY
jgi:hypothetical protein